MKKIQHGAVTIIFSLLILIMLFVIASTFSNITIQKTQIISETETSLKAYQAADTGLEYALYRFNTPAINPNGKNITQTDFMVLVLGAGRTYPENACSGDTPVNVIWTNVQVGVSSYCIEPVGSLPIYAIQVIGKAGKTRRAVGVVLP